jgi:hypothetical protein
MPQLYDFEVWAAEAVRNLFTEAPAIVAEERWADWADYLSSTTTGLQYGVPSSQGFQDWKSWATRVYQVMM